MMDPTKGKPGGTETGSPRATPLRVAVADDDTLLREGLAILLERSGFEIVGLVGNAADLMTLVRDKSPELVIVDIRMPPTNTTEGLEAARQIRAEWPDIGYLLKSRVIDLADFVESLERIARGGSVVDPALVNELVSRRRQDPLAVLSTREREVLALMAEGRSNVGIGRQLWVA